MTMPTGVPLRLCSRAHSCGTLYAGQSFMAKQSSKPRVKAEEASRENIEEDLRAPYLNCHVASACFRDHTFIT